MKIYGNNFSFNSNKVRFAANAMGLKYEFQNIDLAAGEQRKPEFLKINPTGRIPVLVDDNGFTIFESNAIARYLAERTGSTLYPKDLSQRSIVNQWMDFGSIHVGAAMSKMFFNTLVYKFVGAEKDEKSLEEGRKFLNTYVGALEAQLKNNSYLAGAELSLADLTVLSILDPVEVVGFDLSAFPKVAAWRKQLQAKDFYKNVYSSFTDFMSSLMPSSS